MLTRLTLTDGRRHIIVGRDPLDLITELEDPGAMWLKAEVLEFDGNARVAADWFTRTTCIPHSLIIGVDQLSPAERREIPDAILAEHEATS